MRKKLTPQETLAGFVALNKLQSCYHDLRNCGLHASASALHELIGSESNSHLFAFELEQIGDSKELRKGPVAK